MAQVIVRYIEDVLLFDANAATHAAQLAAARKARGCPVNMRDTFIAGIALATRNVRHFDALSVPAANVRVANPLGGK